MQTATKKAIENIIVKVDPIIIEAGVALALVPLRCKAAEVKLCTNGLIKVENIKEAKTAPAKLLDILLTIFFYNLLYVNYNIRIHI